MIARIAKGGIAAAALLAMPGIAIAGTSTATGSASFNVTTQCSVTGATVKLGTFTTSQTWGDVGAALGVSNGSYTPGSQGFEYLNWGSVTCDNGTPYTLKIIGTWSASKRIAFDVNGKKAVFDPMVKKVGGATVADSTGWVGAGQHVASNGALSATGTGAKQDVLGNVVLSYSAAGITVTPADALSVTGTYTDALTYTLSF